MATMDDLEREVRKLRRQVNELKGVGREQAQVAELVSNDLDGNQPQRTGFARACAESNEQLCEQLEHEAVARLRSGTVAHQGPSVVAFRQDFARLGATRLDELLSKYR